MRASGSASVSGMAIAQIGPLTTGLEVAATAIGAGVVVFGVVAGLVRLSLGWPRQSVEEGATTGGYIGGGLGGIAVAIDLVLRYAGLK
jgi:hypothetical protein